MGWSKMIVLQTNASDGIQGAFSGAVETLKYKKQRDHVLLIMSCYVDFPTIQGLIERLAGQVRLTRVRLAFEFMEAFRSRLPNDAQRQLDALKSWCGKQDVTFTSSPIRMGALMHAKGYALIQQKGDGTREGVVCIGSGNATPPGLGIGKKRSVNIEMAYVSHTPEAVQEFIKCWNKVVKHRRKLTDAAKREDAYEFKYALLASGVFLKDWRETVRSKLGITYRLTPKGQSQWVLGDPYLVSLGAKKEQSTFSLNPFASAVDMPPGRLLPDQFTRGYTVDTLVGRWCPRSVWAVIERKLSRDAEFETFLKQFLAATDAGKLAVIAGDERKKSDKLVEFGFVTEVKDRIERWTEKIESFRDNSEKLMRIFLKFEPFDLPYDYQSRQEVSDLWDSLFTTIESRDRGSPVIQKISEADDVGDLAALALTTDEIETLENLISR